VYRYSDVIVFLISYNKRFVVCETEPSVSLFTFFPALFAFQLLVQDVRHEVDLGADVVQTIVYTG